jgi:hypothetical protein
MFTFWIAAREQVFAVPLGVNSRQSLNAGVKPFLCEALPGSMPH